MTGTTTIAYGTQEEGWFGYPEYITRLIEERQAVHICEVGGGANPLLSRDRFAERPIEYTLMDISRTELDKAPAGYEKIVADAGSPDFRLEKQFDLVFSKMLMEHVRDAEQFHKNVLTILASGGMAVHFFPTLYTLPYIVNYLMPERLTNRILQAFAPRDTYQYAKFPAYYHWCRGPLPSQIEKFRRIGYDVIEYRGFFGHRGYYQKMDILQKLHLLKTHYLLRHPHPLFTSYAYVVLKKR